MVEKDQEDDVQGFQNLQLVFDRIGCNAEVFRQSLITQGRGHPLAQESDQQVHSLELGDIFKIEDILTDQTIKVLAPPASGLGIAFCQPGFSNLARPGQEYHLFCQVFEDGFGLFSFYNDYSATKCGIVMTIPQAIALYVYPTGIGRFWTATWYLPYFFYMLLASLDPVVCS